MAITRYLARKYKVDGCDNLALFASSEMLVEEAVDILKLIADAHDVQNSGSDSKYHEMFNVQLPPHLQVLEAMLVDGPTFHVKFDRLVLGDFTIFSVLNLLSDVKPAVLNPYPKLTIFYKHILKVGDIQRTVSSLPVLFERNRRNTTVDATKKPTRSW